MNYKAIGELVEKARQQDGAAAEELYTLLSKSLYYYALRMLNNSEDAMDALQETWISFYSNIHNIKKADATVAYLKRTMHNHCLKILRKGGNFVSYEDSDDLDLEYGYGEQEDFLPEGFVLNRERDQKLSELVSRLPEAQRSVVILHYYDQLSAREIADILSVAEAAVYNRLSRARGAMRQWCNELLESEVSEKCHQMN